MRKLYLLLAVVLLLSLFFYLSWDGFEPTEIGKRSSDYVSESKHQVIIEDDTSSETEEFVSEGLYEGAHNGERIVGPALSYMRVTLPQPLDEPWKAFTIDSVSIFRDERSKEHALSVLPNWIRNALREGKDEKAARFLNTLILLTEDESLKVSDLAIIELYRLGDINGIAFRKIGARLNDESENFFYNDDNKYLGQRQQILNDLLFYDDRRFVDKIYTLWQAQSEIDLSKVKETRFPDFGYYLEEVGVELPLEYWHSRIDMSAHWENTYDVLQRKGNTATAQILEDYFLTTERARGRSTEKVTRPIVAAAIYNLTGKAEYLDFVKTKALSVQSDYKAGTMEESRIALITFAKISPSEAMPLLRDTRLDGQIRSIALDALASIPDEESSDIISNEAIRIITETRRFPRDTLEALANQNTEYALNLYDEIKGALLSGEYGWNTPISNFDRLDFIRYER